MKRDEHLKTTHAANVSRDASDDDHGRTMIRRNTGLVELLLSCPVKGWFEPVERADTTEHIEVPSSSIRLARCLQLTCEPQTLCNAHYGLAALKVSKIMLPGASDSDCQVPAFSSNKIELSGTDAVSQCSL